MDSSRPTSDMGGFMPSVGCATQPRLLGDGMDSESLKTKMPPPRLSSTGRYTNLTSSDKLASVTKSPKLRYVAREPVRAAVKPLTADPVKSGGRVVNFVDPQRSNASCSVNMMAPIASRTGDRDQMIVTMSGGGGSSTVGGGGGVGLPVPSDGVREVEGRSESPSDVVKLREEKAQLEEELHVQNNINTDLKKLLVASVGDDLHYKVESLIRTKATLACEIGDYTKKIYEDYENLDQLSIQADMWRSKFMANKVLIEKLNGEVRRQEHRWTMAEQALRQLLEERQELSSRMIDTHRYLKLLRDSFNATAVTCPPTQISDLLQLSRVNQVLADAVKLRLLGSVPLLRAALDAGIENGLTPAEKLACQVMATLQVLAEAESTATGSKGGATVTVDTFARFHPNVNYDNITLQCCSRCKGDLQVV